MNCLIVCEESQAITKWLRFLGHNAYSCDIQECSGGFPQWHIKGDCLALLNGFTSFITQDNQCHCIGGKWDLIIAHPPCTYLSFAGNRHFNVDKYGQKAIERIKKRESAAEFFMQIWNCNCEHLAIENPVGYMNTHFRKPDQIINPYEFGDSAFKRTCLWVRGLPLLYSDYLVQRPAPIAYCGGKPRYFTEMTNHGDRQKLRSKTFDGIARAMAYQYTCNFYMDVV